MTTAPEKGYGNMLSKKRNLLIVMTDQQKTDTLASYGNPYIGSDGTDRLAEHGLVFDRHYVTSPLCVPSRASIWSAQYPHASGVMLNDDGREIFFPEDIPTLGHSLRGAGYRTGYIGKWHLGREKTPQHGWDDAWWTHLRGSYEQWLEEERITSFDEVQDRYLQRAQVPFDEAHDTVVTSRTIDFIRAHRAEPFAVVCSMRAPHDPYIGPFDDMFAPEDVSLPPTLNETFEDKPTSQAMGRPRDQFLGLGDSDARRETSLRSMVAGYWGLTKLVERNVERLLETIDELGLTEDTIVVYTSDHGDMMGAHGLLSKGNFMYEDSVRVPLIVSCPGSLPAGERVPHLTSGVDLTPTILDLLDLPVPASMQGVSARQLWDFAHNRRSAAFIEVYETYGRWSPVFAVVTDEWKYCWYLADEDELYNLKNDPHEVKNLIHDSHYRETCLSMRSRIATWLEGTGDVRLSKLAQMMPEYAPDLIKR